MTCLSGRLQCNTCYCPKFAEVETKKWGFHLQKGIAVYPRLRPEGFSRSFLETLLMYARICPMIIMGSLKISSTIPCSSVQFSCSFVSDSLWSMGCSMAGFPVHHWLPELAQTHCQWVSDAIQPSSYPLSPPSPPAFSLSQHQGLFQWVSSAH